MRVNKNGSKAGILEPSDVMLKHRARFVRTGPDSTNTTTCSQLPQARRLEPNSLRPHLAGITSREWGDTDSNRAPELSTWMRESQSVVRCRAAGRESETGRPSAVSLLPKRRAIPRGMAVKGIA
jgi:hypothetical protein